MPTLVYILLVVGGVTMQTIKKHLWRDVFKAAEAQGLANQRPNIDLTHASQQHMERCSDATEAPHLFWDS